MRVQGFFYDIQIFFSYWEISANISCASSFLVQNWLHVTVPGMSGPLVLFIWPRSQIGCKADGRKAIWHFKSYQYTNERAKLQRKTRRFQTWLSSSIAISKIRPNGLLSPKGQFFNYYTVVILIYKNLWIQYIIICVRPPKFGRLSMCEKHSDRGH